MLVTNETCPVNEFGSRSLNLGNGSHQVELNIVSERQINACSGEREHKSTMRFWCYDEGHGAIFDMTGSTVAPLGGSKLLLKLIC